MSRFGILGAFALLLLVTTVSATTCTRDDACSSTEYCDESGAYIGTCTTINMTLACGGVDMSCATDSDCSGVGRAQCFKGICLSSGAVGEACQLDTDCYPVAGGGYVRCVQVTVSGETQGICTPSTWIASDVCAIRAQCPKTSAQNDLVTCLEHKCVAKSQTAGICAETFDCVSATSIDFEHGLNTYSCDTTNHVCRECSGSYALPASIVGADVAENYFCNINSVPVCGSLNFYGSLGFTNSVVVPVIEEKKSDGDACDDSACCFTSNCVGGTCVGLTESNPPSAEGEMAQEICGNSSYGSLYSGWFDGIGVSGDRPNSTFFADWFGYTDTDFFTINTANLRGNPTTMEGYLGERRLDGDDYTMTAFFYDNSTGDVCYILQDGVSLTSHCIAGCMASGQAVLQVGTCGAGAEDLDTNVMGNRAAHIGADPAHCDTNIQCKDANMGIIIFDSDATLWDGAQIGIAVVDGLSGVHAGYYSVSSEQGGINNVLDSYDGSAHHYKSLPDPSGVFDYMSPILQDWDMSWSSQYVRAKANAVGSQLTPTIAEGNYTEDVACCVEDSDCQIAGFPDGYCCLDSGTCGECGTSGEEGLDCVFWGSSGPMLADTFCPNTAYPFTFYWIEEGIPGISMPKQVDGETGAFVISGGDGSYLRIGSDQCTEIDEPWCYFDEYPAAVTYVPLDSPGATPETNTICFEYMSTGESCCFDMNVYNSTVCNWATVKVCDATLLITEGEKRYLQGVTISGGSTTERTKSDGTANIGGISLGTTLTLENDGYDTMEFTFTNESQLNHEIELCMDRSDVYSDLPPSWEFNTTAPNSTSQVTEGMLQVTYAAIWQYLPWILLIIIFLIGIGVVRYLVIAALG